MVKFCLPWWGWPLLHRLASGIRTAFLVTSSSMFWTCVWGEEKHSCPHFTDEKLRPGNLGGPLGLDITIDLRY